MVNIIRDMKTKETNVVYLCYSCDVEDYPADKPIVNDMNAKKDLNTDEWICSDCQMEELNKRKLRLFGPQYLDCQSFIKVEERKVLRHNDAARRLNEVSGQYLMGYKRNRYTGHMPLSPNK